MTAPPDRSAFTGCDESCDLSGAPRPGYAETLRALAEVDLDELSRAVAERLVSAFGNGLADDKLAHSRVEDFARFDLEEEPKVRSVPTLDLATEQDREDAIGRLRELVVKPRYGQGGAGVVIGAHADSADLERLAGEMREHPEDFIAQPIIALSFHPTVIDGELQPRHVDLRSFAFCGANDEVRPIPAA